MKILRNNQGMTLFMVIFVMAFFLLFITGGLVFSQLELKKASNLKLATQAVEVADAGLQHALALVPWVWDFDGQLNTNCGTPPTPPCTLILDYPFLNGSGFSYTVKIKNDPPEAVPTDDTNGIAILTSEATGPAGSRRSVQAYVRRSVASFAPPAALYINAASAAPYADSSNSSANGFFDLDNNVVIAGNDTNTNDTAGPARPPIWAIATTSSSVTTALTREYTGTYSTGSTGTQLHDVFHNNTPGSTSYLGVNLGTTVEPSISTVSDVLNINTIAANFFNQLSTVKYFNGLITDSTTCPSSNPCQFGTSATPQITYIKETYDTDITLLRGYVIGYGVLVLEGRPIIGDNFKFYGLIVHKRANGSAFISFEDYAKVYGGVLLGSYNEGDGNGEKARFGIKDYARLYYSSQALAAVDSNWGSLLPKPARVFAWLDK